MEGTPQITWTAGFFAVLTFLGLVATAATTLAWFVGAQRRPLSTLTRWLSLVPVVGLVLGVLLLGERHGGWMVAGANTYLPDACGPPCERGPKPLLTRTCGVDREGAGRAPDRALT